MCNLGHDTAEARFWAIRYKIAYDDLYELFGLNNVFDNKGEEDIATRLRDN